MSKYKVLNKSIISLIVASITIVLTFSPNAHANPQLHHKGNDYSSYIGGSTQAVNGWSTVVLSTSTLMDENKRLGRTYVQAWARLDTIKAHYGNYYIPTVAAIETKMKTVTHDSSFVFDIQGTNPGENLKEHEIDTTIFDLLDYKISGVGVIGSLLNQYSNGITTGTDQDISNSKNGTLTFLWPTDASLPNTISWKDANKAIGAYKKSGVTAEFNFRIIDGLQVHVAPQARVQYGLYTAKSITPLKIWSAEAYVQHTIN
ncbi:hypothetical protein [Paenibacillus sp. ALJ109b]|uniref:hypothetical protein n=1 Tax=Paenibacillus sp. ALJ109b TaxID=2709068 RepID=UPI0013D5E6EE|nr:hypothetical protein [Paenibacillus sp. ALJ109b]NEU59998.1 hypothetical protein [Paenibacillus sp. ALJ109b]